MITYKEILWIQVIKKWIYYEMIKNSWLTVLKFQTKIEYAIALTNWHSSDFMMKLETMVYELKKIIPGNQDDH